MIKFFDHPPTIGVLWVGEIKFQKIEVMDYLKYNFSYERFLNFNRTAQVAPDYEVFGSPPKD